MKFTVSAIRDTRTILNFFIPQFVLHQVDIQEIILTAIMHVDRKTGSCIPPPVLLVIADPSEVAQPPPEQAHFAIHSLINQALAVVLHNQNHQGVRKFEFEPRACSRVARELREGLF
jgi:hypothetical protein